MNSFFRMPQQQGVSFGRGMECASGQASVAICHCVPNAERGVISNLHSPAKPPTIRERASPHHALVLEEFFFQKGVRDKKKGFFDSLFYFQKGCLSFKRARSYISQTS